MSNAKVYREFLKNGLTPKIKELFFKLLENQFKKSDIVKLEKEIDTFRFKKIDIVKEEGYNLMYISLIDNTSVIQNAWAVLKHEIEEIEEYLYTLPFMSVKLKKVFEKENSVRMVVLIDQNGLERDERILVFNVNEYGIVTAYMLKYKTIEDEETLNIELVKESVKELVDTGNIDEIDFEYFLSEFRD